MKNKQLIYTLFIPTVGLTLGISAAYHLDLVTISHPFTLIIYASLFCLFLYLSQRINPSIFRNAFIASVFFLVGLSSFILNDVRLNSTPIDYNEKIYHAKIESIKNRTLKGQLIQVSIKAEKQSRNWKKLKDVKANLFVYRAEKNYLPDQNILIKCQLTKIPENVNPGAFDSKFYYETQGIQYFGFIPTDHLEELNHDKSFNYYLWKSREYFKSKIQSVVPESEEGVAIALLLGDKSLLEDSIVNAFTNTGTMHVLAVSGMHVGIILLILLLFLEQFSRFISKKQALIIALILIWLYGFLAGGSAAVMRSVVMFSIISSAQLFDRPSSNLNNLFLSAIVLLLWNPWNLFDIGFQLSYAAMIGLFLFTEPIESLISVENKILKWFWSGTCAGVAATICTTPFVLYWFHQFPNYFILSNFGVMILGFPLLLFGFILLLSPLIPLLFKIAAILLSSVIFLLIFWVKLIDTIPGAISNGFQLNGFLLLLGILVIIFWIIYIRKKIYFYLSCILSVLLISFVSFQRFQSPFQNKFLILNHESIQLIVCSNNKAYAFYEQDTIDGIQKYDTLFSSNFERFSGFKTQLIPLKTDNFITINNKSISIKKNKGGWIIKSSDKQVFYRDEFYSFTPKNTDTTVNKKQIQDQMNLPHQLNVFNL